MRCKFTLSIDFTNSKDKPFVSIDGFVISSFLYKEFVTEWPKGRLFWSLKQNIQKGGKQ